MSGYEGAVTIDSTAIAIVSKFNITNKANLEDTTGMQVNHPGYKAWSQTLPEWEGSFEGWISTESADQSPFKGSGSTPPAITKGAVLAAVFTNDLGDYSGNIIVEQVEIISNTAGFVEFSVSFKGQDGLLEPGMS
jgi:hypothetical protein